MYKNIAIVVPHKGLGDILFHINFMKSISKKEGKKIILIANKSTKADHVYKDTKFIKRIIFANLRRPNFFLYIIRIFNLISIINNNKIDKIYYTGKNKWQVIAFKFLHLFFKKEFFYINTNEKYIIRRLNNFLKKEKIKNLNNYNLELPKLSNVKNKKIFVNHNTPSVFININTSERQIDISNRKLLHLISKINNRYKTIYINSNTNNNLEKFSLNNKKIIKTYKYNINELCHLIKNSAMYIGTESGPAVIASLLGLKTHIFFSKDVNKESNLLPTYNERKYYNIEKFDLFYKNL